MALSGSTFHSYLPRIIMVFRTTIFPFLLKYDICTWTNEDPHSDTHKDHTVYTYVVRFHRKPKASAL